MNLNMAGGAQGMMKEGSTLADGVDEAVLKNIGATKQLAKIVQSSLGPNGMKKLIINHLGKTLVSSDCGTIARELEVVHPAAQMVSMASAAQDSEVGDGTNLVVSFSGELLNNLGHIAQGKLPVRIMTQRSAPSVENLQCLSAMTHLF